MDDDITRERRHPRVAKCLAVPAPMPELAPVISTTFPSRVMAILFSVFFFFLA